MASIKEQFQFQIIRSHFEVDTHIEVRDLETSNLKVLSAESADKDILVVQYNGSPNLSFFDTKGKLLDVDHYLPENYKDYDGINLESIISSFKDSEITRLKSKDEFDNLLDEVFSLGNQQFVPGLEQKFGLRIPETILFDLMPKLETASSESISDVFRDSYDTFYNLLSEIIFKLQKNTGYVHITPADNIIITPLNKRCGMSVIVETQDINNQLLDSSKWNILRTESKTKLDQSLVFRTNDVKNYFEATSYSDIYETERYKLLYDDNELSIDSYLDNTDNLLKLKVVNDCYKIMASDHNMIVALTKKNEITIVNTHKSVVPHKWPKKIRLPESIEWIRTDENLSIVFCQDANGMIFCYDISCESPEKIVDLGVFAQHFELDQNGHLICLDKDSSELIKIKTNLQEIEIPSNQKNFNTVFKNLSHLFKGESLFVKTQFAKPISSETVQPENKLPSAIEKARYDFETNVENMLVNSDNTYEELLNIQNKIAIARQNITEELMVQADKENIFLVGQRLKTTINNIMLPSELRVRNLVENLRAKNIIVTTRSFRAKAEDLDDPNAFREILNNLRVYKEELDNMLSENSADILGEFKDIQEEMNLSFSEQITQEGNTLQEFIASEIDEIEAEIKKTHHTKVLENILGTHPAAVELMTLLKQPFVLQSIAKEKKLSPAVFRYRIISKPKLPKYTRGYR